jgi:cytochrome b pre-mRNA-processing protein 3
MILNRLFGDSNLTRRATTFYSAVVKQARQVPFYRDHGVPDTVDGRFELIVLHAVLALRRLHQEGADGDELGQAMFDVLIDDMDRSLREMGVGDLGVGRRVKAMGEAFYGRSGAYEKALDDGDGALVEALARNVFGTVKADDCQVGAMAAYVRRQIVQLASQPGSDLLAGTITFDSPLAMEEAENGES